MIQILKSASDGLLRMVRFENVGVRYGVGPEVLRDINLHIAPGSFQFLTGASGAGKSSLLKLMYLGQLPSRGIMQVFGHNFARTHRKDLPALRRRIGVVFQDFRLLKNLNKRCLVEIRPMTGRTHQIRVHSHYIGCTVTGDKLYGLADDGFIKWLEQGQSYLDQTGFSTPRQLLHAMEIGFVHPESNKKLTIRADDSKMMRMIPTQ